MKFFERIRNRYLYKTNTKDSGEQQAALFFMEKSYLLKEFEVNFHQAFDSKGNPSGSSKGGLMKLTMESAPDYTINEWMCRENLLRNGEIRFYTDGFKISKKADYVVRFRDALCVKYEKKVSGKGIAITLFISPRVVRIGEEEFANRWKDPERFIGYTINNE